MNFFFRKTEPVIFYFIVLLHCLPVLLLKFFITHDGPAHVYNAYLIKSLLISGDVLTTDFYSLRSFPEANWIGHAGMALLNFLISPVAAERVLLLVYIVFLPVSFRKLIRLTEKGSVLLSYLIFPFIYSYIFYGGLYNFMLGVPFLLFAFFYLLNKKIPFRSGEYVFLLLTGLVMYFSHLVIFGIYALMIPVMLLVKQMDQWQGKPDELWGAKKSFVKNSMMSLMMLLPGLAFSIKFIFDKASFRSVAVPIDLKTLIQDLMVVTPVIALTDQGEVKYGVVFGVVILLLMGVAVFSIWKTRKKEQLTIPKSSGLSKLWLTAGFLMLLFYFIIPDDFATGGVVKVRFSYFFFLFVILWLASQKIPTTVVKYSAAAILLLSLARLFHFTKSSIQLSNDAEVYYSASELIEPNSIVLPLNYSTNWMHSNISNYLGTYQHNIVLDNYEAGREHFPLAWNENRNPVALLGSFNGEIPLCADVSGFERNTSKKINYIILWRYQNELTDSCSLQIQSTLRTNYRLCFKSLDKQLYMYKRNQ